MSTAPNTEPSLGNIGDTPLPSIKTTLLKPKVLLASLIFSIVLNFILLVFLLLVSGSSSPSPAATTTTQTPTRATTPVVSTRPSPRPSFTPDEALVEYEECFHNCSVEEMLAGVRTKALNYTDFKAQIVFHDDKGKFCYGNYLESGSSFKESNYYLHHICSGNYLSRPPQTTIQISDNIYSLNNSGNWSLEGKPRISQTKLIRVVDEVIEQQEKVVESHISKPELKQIKTTSKTVNDLNQLVTKTANLVVNEYLDVLSYEIEVVNVYKESGDFFGLGIQNSIEPPL